nr:MAG TPA: hypothetical protein [Bacteriophage sp.]
MRAAVKKINKKTTGFVAWKPPVVLRSCLTVIIPFFVQ